MEVYLVMSFGKMETVGGNWKSNVGTARLNPTSPGTASTLQTDYGQGLPNAFPQKQKAACISIITSIHTRTHTIQTDWVKAEHTFMTQYFPGEFHTGLRINNLGTSHKWKLLCVSLPHILSHRGEGKDGRKLNLYSVGTKEKLKHYILILIQVS